MGIIRDTLNCRTTILLCILCASAGALAAALIAQFAYDLEPCILCLYQRIPFLVAIALAILGLVFKRTARVMIGLSALAFLGNAGLAFYHFGVEERWWVSAFEGCAVPENFLSASDNASILDQLMKTPSVPCTQVAWVDPIFRMSMAFYNIWFCVGMGLLCLLALFKRPLPSA